MFGSRSDSVDRLRRPWSLVPLAGALLAGCMGGPGERRARYSCDGGRLVSVIFSGGVARVFDGGGPPVVLDRRRARNGFWYESATHSIRGNGRMMTYTIGRMVPMRCRKIGSGRW